MGIRNGPYFRIATGELANWLELQGIDRWWTVDGDRFLAQRVNLPAPADELANALRKYDRFLLLADQSQDRLGKGEQIDATRLAKLTENFGKGASAMEERPNWLADGELELCWEDDNNDEGWLIYEDEETSEAYRSEAVASPQKE